MVSRMEGISKICRFCLCRENLTSLSEVTDSGFSLADVERYTGIQIDDTALYSVCVKCCLTIRNSICFRRICMQNDVTFKQLLVMLNVINNKAVGTDSIASGSDNRNSARISQYAENKGCDMDVIELDGNDSDDYSGACQKVSKGTTNSYAGNRNIKPASSITKSKCSIDGKSGGVEECTLSSAGEFDTILPNDCDSDDSMESIYEQAMYSAEQEEYTRAKYEERQLCSLCGILSRDYTNHMKRTHGNERTFVCPHCPKSYRENFHLKRHINTCHEKRIIYTCEQCGKGFTNPSSHFYHMKNSHGESDFYDCETCHRKFKSIDGFRKHQKEHSLSSYPCQHCDKFFKTIVTLEKHQHRYHLGHPTKTP